MRVAHLLLPLLLAVEESPVALADEVVDAEVPAKG
jgi:hypothetical protein